MENNDFNNNNNDFNNNDFNNNQNQNQNQNQNNSRPLSLASMICGIVPWIIMWIPGLSILSLPSAIAAIVLAAIAKDKEGKNGMRTAGLILGIVSLSLSILGIILLLALGAAFFGM